MEKGWLAGYDWRETMTMKKITMAGMTWLILLWLIPQDGLAGSVLNVQVSILPQKYFVERIGKERVSVDVLVKPGKSPEVYSPSPDQIRKLMAAHVYFRIGIDFENGIIPKLESGSGLKIVDTREGIVLRDMEEHGHDEDGHPDHKADYRKEKNAAVQTGKDPHIWVDPENVKIQAGTILKALSSLDPAGAETYRANYESFIRDLSALDLHLKETLKELKGETLFVFHPAFGYFTDRYGMSQMAVETMGKAPKGKELSNIIKLAKKEKVRVIFVQPQFDQSSAVKIAAAIDGAVLSIDNLAYDYLSSMETMAKTIADALKKK